MTDLSSATEVIPNLPGLEIQVARNKSAGVLPSQCVSAIGEADYKLTGLCPVRLFL